ncbi:hypothetical protein ACJMK2_011902 [Sinanodonta woodiana]|uniref:Uncharacterized protein n=1 Tax=Sinanodonta woodiana TaxID=1069815 RepID=A0ABD3V6H3_SINWO
MAGYLKLYYPDLSPPQIKEFKQRFRSLEICIDNKTEEALYFSDSYFFHSKMFKTNEYPREVAARSGSVYFLVNTTFLRGVSGGWKFKVVEQDLYLYIGFSNPIFGSYKTFVSLKNCGTLSAKWPYKELKDGSMKTDKCDKYIVDVTFTDPHYSSFQRIHCRIRYNEFNV